MNIHDVGNDNDQQQHNANEAGNDGLLLEYYTMDDIDIPTLERFRQMFQNLHPEHQWNSAEHKEFLTNFGGYTRDRRTGKEGLTMAGLLMFGKGLSYYRKSVHHFNLKK